MRSQPMDARREREVAIVTKLEQRISFYSLDWRCIELRGFNFKPFFAYFHGGRREKEGRTKHIRESIHIEKLIPRYFGYERNFKAFSSILMDNLINKAKDYINTSIDILVTALKSNVCNCITITIVAWIFLPVNRQLVPSLFDSKIQIYKKKEILA